MTSHETPGLGNVGLLQLDFQEWMAQVKAHEALVPWCSGSCRLMGGSMGDPKNGGIKHTVDARNPAPGCIKAFVDSGINHQPQLVFSPDF